MGNIFNMFGPSPIRPIEQHIHKAYTCAKHLLPLLNAALGKNWDEARIQHQHIIQLEKEADDIKRELRLHLPTGLFLPVARTDLLELLKTQDEIANKSKDIAGLIMGRKMHIPANLAPLMQNFLSRCLDAAKQACKAINELDELLETGFRGNEVKLVEEMILTLDSIEKDCDEQLAKIRSELFSIETQLPSLEAVFLYQLLQWIGELADAAQSVGGRLQILIAR
jgi:predicted phosphate transport protein (TIGR00153 family)